MVTIIQGSARVILSTLADESVQCCVTSPPYWGLRDYNVAGQLGLEATPEEYVAKLVRIFREVRRILKKDGTLWLNLGDSYADKSLVGIPWLAAFALRADGWYLRRDVIWGKPNGMPESTRDRPCSAHEYVFMLTKSARYLYNYEDVRLPPLPSSVARLSQHVAGQRGSARANAGGKTNGPMKAVAGKQIGHTRRHAGFNERWDAMDKAEQQQNGAALRSVWWIPPAQSKDAHFAVMPEDLAALCVLASSKPGDMVLDPFAGTGTTAKVAEELGRHSTAIELNPEYIPLIERRCNTTRGLGI